jgi:hypothetical protein
METPISKFLTILTDNSYTANYENIPDEVDNRDEILAELDEMDGLPESRRFFEINGFSSTIELQAYLEKIFNQFKVDYLQEIHNKNKPLVQELKNQIKIIKYSLEQAVYESNQIQDDDLHELIGIKINFLDELNKFIADPQTYVKSFSSNTTIETGEKEKHSFNWLKGQKELNDLFENMKANNLISLNTQQEDFTAVFSNKPLSTLKHIKWEKGPRLLAYFIDQLTEKKYIPRTPKWTLIKHCFIYSSKQDGNYVPASENLKAHMNYFKKYGKPKYARLVDNLFSASAESGQ